MKPALQLSIPEPCAENWNAFLPRPEGGFCLSCSKTVIDFTRMNEDEILQYFSTRDGHTCGRFRSGQLKAYRDFDTVTIRPSFTFLKAGVVALLLTVVGKPAIAHTSHIRTHTAQSFHVSIANPSPIGDQTIRGVVTSAEDHTALPGVNVVLKGKAVGTVTNEDGEFKFPQLLKEGDILVFSFIGLETIEYRIGKAEEPLYIEMKLDQEALNEVIITGEVHAVRAVKKGLIHKVSELFSTRP